MTTDLEKQKLTKIIDSVLKQMKVQDFGGVTCDEMVEKAALIYEELEVGYAPGKFDRDESVSSIDFQRIGATFVLLQDWLIEKRGVERDVAGRFGRFVIRGQVASTMESVREMDHPADVLEFPKKRK